MNPYALLAAVALAALALFGAERAGEARGAALQGRTDQVKIDKVHTDIDALHQQAAQLLAAAAARDAQLAQAAAQLHLHQEIAHENDQARTEAARRALAAADGGRLRVAVTVPAGCGRGGDAAVPAAGDAAGPADTAVVELPSATARDLRDLVLDADRIADWYRKCYRFAFPAWQPDEVKGAEPAASSP